LRNAMPSAVFGTNDVANFEADSCLRFRNGVRQV